jgi:hypothetical protein
MMNILNWPVQTPDAVSGLEAIISSGSWTVDPLPLYVDGVLADPKRYEGILVGSLVIVDFTLHHWNFTGKSDSYRATVQKIYPLAAPKPKAQPRFKKRPSTLTDSGSPMKRAKSGV